MKEWFFQLIFRVSGYEFSPELSEKIPSVINGLIFVVIFVSIFAYLYHRYFWKNQAARKMFI
ncbi:MAG: hypothetical protein AAB731_01460 [Patescibacteria group bacterium]